MSYEYAGSLFDNKHDADLAKAHDFMTACGRESVKDSVEAWRQAPELIIDHAIKDGWFDDMGRDDVAELLTQWAEEGA